MSNSYIYWGSVWHARKDVNSHKFRYPYFMFCLNLREIPKKFSTLFCLFGFDRFGIYSIKSRDYLNLGENHITEKIENFIKQLEIDQPIKSVQMLTMPKLLGYAFNPVNFYILESIDKKILGMIIEVNNTFGERHIYTVKTKSPVCPPVEFDFDKNFFVSPFYNVAGRYLVTLKRFDDLLDLRVDLLEQNIINFSAAIMGERKPLTNLTILKTVIKFPLTSVLTMFRIHYQALLLRYRHGIRPVEKPPPSHLDTICVKYNFFHRARLWILTKWRSK
ncbi:MAG TPA: DUF1365 domain-containing protein [Oligoflexia bacterium]|nr:DUF1365 domain-containing protein [Oligoflexia bacterium]HMP26434.1 DUF1365 domain-containing protein [Oligoflexia bacterium]